MSTNQWTELAVAVVALLLSAVATWAEISLVAVSRVDVRRLFDNRLSREDAIAIERTQRLRSAVLLIEVLAAAIAVALFTWVFADLLGDRGLLWGLLTSLGILLVVGRLIPRILANEEASSENDLPHKVGRVLALLFAPIVRPAEWIVTLFGGNRRRRYEAEPPADEATETLSAQHPSDWERSEPYPIEEDEQDMISGILHLEEVTARQIMVPRIDIVAAGREMLLSEAVDVAIGAGHSRIPVHGHNMDEILGVIYAKDLLAYVNEPHDGITVEALMRPAYFVPESKRVDDLLHELQQQKIHLAVVVDEYGGTAGVVSIEDILEEIVGEIQDEYDRETPPFEIISDDELIVDGRLTIDDLCDEMELDWDGPETGTVGGFIQRQLGRIPVRGETVETDSIRLTVLNVEHRRVRKVRVERLSEATDTGATDDGATTPPADQA
ncbi:MAG TPA: hemolysin family protein [Thermomicrobiales bacterium]|nr:HlyC/CorC family transporter [Chloroflexota bacterium]HQZ88651.1 hemolysin family protein [Thermomicrobiales bacterium]HRA30947.1 hemolysin family protein [Thermomicrobiales bacterium]